MLLDAHLKSKMLAHACMYKRFHSSNFDEIVRDVHKFHIIIFQQDLCDRSCVTVGQPSVIELKAGAGRGD